MARYDRVRVRALARRDVLAGGAALVAGCTTRAPHAVDTESSPEPEAVLGEAEVPAITSNAAFYVTWFNEAAPLDDSWTLSVEREGVALASLDLPTLQALVPRDVELTLQCIESRPDAQAMDNAVWQGQPLTEVLAALGLGSGDWAGAGHVAFRCADVMELSLPLDELEGLWLVWGMNGEELPLDHGWPVRLLAPGHFGWLNPKQIVTIDFLDDELELWWAKLLKAWAASGTLDPESDVLARDLAAQALVVSPTDLDLVDEGARIRVIGKAFAGSDPIATVEVRVDDGPWEQAELTYQGGANIWSTWRWVWDPDGPGVYTLEVRATTASGATTTSGFPANRIPYEGGMSLEVEVG